MSIQGDRAEIRRKMLDSALDAYSARRERGLAPSCRTPTAPRAAGGVAPALPA